MTAADLNRLSAELAEATQQAEGVTEQVRITGLVFDYDAPLPPLKQHPRTKLWEPAAVGFRDLPTSMSENLEVIIRDAKAEALEEAAAEFGPTYHGLWLQAQADDLRRR